MSGSAPLKTQAWAQGIYEISSSKKEDLGALRILSDGRKFRYAKAGEAMVAGKICQMADAVANHIKLTGTNTASIGDYEINFTVGATAVGANDYQDGFLQVYDGAAGTVGLQYGISSNTACGVSEITVLKLKDPIKIAIISSDTLSLVANPWCGTLHNASLAHGCAGVAPVAVTSGYYFWCQTGGVANILNGGGTTLGAGIVPSATEGAVKTQPDGALDSGPIGYCIGYAAVDAKYCPFFLTID